MKKSPKEITQILSEKYSQCGSILVLKNEAHPSGYLNFFADWTKLSKLILSCRRLEKFKGHHCLRILLPFHFPE